MSRRLENYALNRVITEGSGNKKKIYHPREARRVPKNTSSSDVLNLAAERNDVLASMKDAGQVQKGFPLKTRIMNPNGSTKEESWFGEEIGHGTYGTAYLKKGIQQPGFSSEQGYGKLLLDAMTRKVIREVMVPSEVIIKVATRGAEGLEQFGLDSVREAVLHRHLDSASCTASMALQKGVGIKKPVCSSDHVPKFYYAGMLREPDALNGRKGKEYYMTMMEHLKKSITLEKFLDQHDGNIDAKTYVMIERAVVSLWLSGVAHGDVHVGNIMIQLDEEGFQAKHAWIIDFGFGIEIPDYMVRMLVKALPGAVYSGVRSLGEMWRPGSEKPQPGRSKFGTGIQTFVNAVQKKRGVEVYYPDGHALMAMYTRIPEPLRPQVPVYRLKVWGGTGEELLELQDKIKSTSYRSARSSTKSAPKKATPARNASKNASQARNASKNAAQATNAGKKAGTATNAGKKAGTARAYVAGGGTNAEVKALAQLASLRGTTNDKAWLDALLKIGNQTKSAKPTATVRNARKVMSWRPSTNTNAQKLQNFQNFLNAKRKSATAKTNAVNAGAKTNAVNAGANNTKKTGPKRPGARFTAAQARRLMKLLKSTSKKKKGGRRSTIIKSPPPFVFPARASSAFAYPAAPPPFTYPARAPSAFAYPAAPPPPFAYPAAPPRIAMGYPAANFGPRVAQQQQFRFGLPTTWKPPATVAAPPAYPLPNSRYVMYPPIRAPPRAPPVYPPPNSRNVMYPPIWGAPRAPAAPARVGVNAKSQRALRKLR